ncbi:hypothetical protein BDV95DRAFT_613265 [Massariosphaeria phaeospora]|uniref:NAD-dependent epimerase/dehydratase domain-containing protein n=1 Tax=Massariosphaeria phaeospora TaxID=100035 RepID=A0A7C8HZM4_9PLEO|nr:hypothetical protein BDV95DRAFT_613265 [Massariosphaeria phaeospora]
MADKDRGLVAITGANGIIGYHCVLHALRTGYRVRCIVRREDAIASIQAGLLVAEFVDRIEFAIVPDNALPGAYDTALQGAAFVIHVAGVWPTPNYHPDNEIWHPFVKSMENILSAAKKSASVKRIVFTQAGAGLVSPDDGDTLGNRMERVLDEYVEVNVHSASFRPPLSSPHHAYCGAKAYCMTYLNSLRINNELPFSIAQVIPGTVIGPSELVSSAKEAYAKMDRMSKALLFDETKARYAFGFVHVEDCARVHVEALEETRVRDHEIPNWFIAAATTDDGKDGNSVWREAGDMIEKEFPDEVKSGLFTVGRDNTPINMPFRVDSRKTQDMLFDGQKFRGLQECVEEVGSWYRSLVKSEESDA